MATMNTLDGMLRHWRRMSPTMRGELAASLIVLRAKAQARQASDELDRAVSAGEDPDPAIKAACAAAAHLLRVQS